MTFQPTKCSTENFFFDSYQIVTVFAQDTEKLFVDHSRNAATQHLDKLETLSLRWYTRWAVTSFGPTEFPCEYSEELLVCYCIDN